MLAHSISYHMSTPQLYIKKYQESCHLYIWRPLLTQLTDRHCSTSCTPSPLLLNLATLFTMLYIDTVTCLRINGKIFQLVPDFLPGLWSHLQFIQLHHLHHHFNTVCIYFPNFQPGNYDLIKLDYTDSTMLFCWLGWREYTARRWQCLCSVSTGWRLGWCMKIWSQFTTHHHWQWPRLVHLIFHLPGFRCFKHQQPAHGDQLKIWAGCRCHERPMETTMMALWHHQMHQIMYTMPASSVLLSNTKMSPLSQIFISYSFEFHTLKFIECMQWNDLVYIEELSQKTSQWSIIHTITKCCIHWLSCPVTTW